MAEYDEDNWPLNNLRAMLRGHQPPGLKVAADLGVAGAGFFGAAVAAHSAYCRSKPVKRCNAAIGCAVQTQADTGTVCVPKWESVVRDVWQGGDGVACGKLTGKKQKKCKRRRSKMRSDDF